MHTTPNTTHTATPEPSPTFWVLGATGYVGKAVVRELYNKYPNARIIAVGHRRIDPWVMEHTHFIMGHLGRFNFKWLLRFPPDCIFHCARMAGGNSWSRGRASRNGERANLRWIEELSSLPKQPSVIYCSGTLMFGNQTETITEGAPLSPIAYARFYRRAEQPWRDTEKLSDVRWAYPAWILGPDSWFRVFFYEPALRNGFVPYYGDGNQQMSLVHLRDCAHQIVGIHANGTPNTGYHIFASEAISQRDFAQMIGDRLGLKVAPLSADELEKKYGRTVAEALTSNIPVGTRYGSWKEQQKLQFAEVDKMLDSVLKDIEHVLPKMA